MVRRPGTPPARHYDLAARSSLHGSGGNAGDGSAAPGRKPPRWSAERRASRVMGRAAPHPRGWSRLASATTTQVRLSALRPPLFWDGCEEIKTKPGRKTASRERDVLRGTRLRSGLFGSVKREEGGRAHPTAAASSCAGAGAMHALLGRRQHLDERARRAQQPRGATGAHDEVPPA